MGQNSQYGLLRIECSSVKQRSCPVIQDQCESPENGSKETNSGADLDLTKHDGYWLNDFHDRLSLFHAVQLPGGLRIRSRPEAGIVFPEVPVGSDAMASSVSILCAPSREIRIALLASLLMSSPTRVTAPQGL
jgi:hypothetical protein